MSETIVTIVQGRPINVTFPAGIVIGGDGDGIAAPIDGQRFIWKPVAGKGYSLNQTTGLYHELETKSVDGFAVLGVSTTGITFSALPAQ